MKKLIAALVAAFVVLVGAAAGVRQVVADDSAPCVKPLTILGSEQTASIEVLEAYLSENIAPKIKSASDLTWASDDFNPTIRPGMIAASIVLVRTSTGSMVGRYHVTLTRDCQGGEWKVVEFKKL